MAAYASTIILICLAVLSYFVHNNAVTISILVLLAIKITPLAQFFPYVEKTGHYLRHHYSYRGGDGPAWQAAHCPPLR
ncbi:Protein of uncharacterised function (DUF441) [Pantoea agglomerans]|uniref:Protein of uncharacterized function (DUF441) n=1 Tax=Enterobacter agglomerans TaxID=549 RepID=A0A379AAF1_ENTAG|nr:Protein of uncharacterised function (DUF441) [Pantoea agglomerans]